MCVFRIKDTYILAQDVARDTLKVLTLWQTKETTLVGPPASFSLQNDNVFHFGSFSYYLGLLGLLIGNFDPVGATIPTIVLFIFSIFYFYKFCDNIKTGNFVQYLATLIYSVSPLVITHMRFFWNPNTVIPLSVFFWYLVTKEKSKKDFEVHFLAGLIMAIIFNFHYFTILPMLVWTFSCIFKKDWDRLTGIVAGFLIGSLPLFFYELKNDFYLSKSLLLNLNNLQSSAVSISTHIGRTLETFMAIVGIKHGEIFYPTAIGNNSIVYWSIFSFLALLSAITIKQKVNGGKIWLLLSLWITILMAAKASDTEFYVRYVFGALPLAIWFLSEMFSLKAARLLIVPVAALILFSTVGVITFQNNINNGYIPLKTLEKISKSIVDEDFKGQYNLTANVDGDAYALALRYFVQRDSVNKPNDVETYGWLDRLYAIAPNFEKIKSENRFEYYASGPWKEPVVTDFGEVKLFRFEK